MRKEVESVASKPSKSKSPSKMVCNAKRVSLSDRADFLPQPQLPLPKPASMRDASVWWVKCASGEWIDTELCHSLFVDINALNNKKHPCWNCPLGKHYREMRGEGHLKDTMLDTILQ